MDKDIALKLAYKIKYERDKRELSQEQLSELTGMSVATIGKIERGIGNITIGNLYRIAKVLELDLGILTNFKF
ncbi:MAG: helix-turn-helix transcriptional regulator [Heliobacteriaceae bacterium]|jgi:transcriptional regulator with XRE-family HTH domain|nr:helix-turn-helix transcriptional regulator [Heliobacteriaceae bacterium]